MTILLLFFPSSITAGDDPVESTVQNFELSGAHLKAFEPAYRYLMQSSLPAKEKNLEKWTVITFKEGDYYFFLFDPPEYVPKNESEIVLDDFRARECWVKKKNYEVVTAPAYGQND
jgi:hypothetical protein